MASTQSHVAGCIFALIAAWGTEASARVLLEDDGLAVRIADGSRCSRSVDMTVVAEQPALFERGSDRLQRVVDAAHAVLAFECPEVREIRVRGVLRGLSGAMFEGTAAAARDWRIEAERTIGAEQVAAAGGAPDLVEGSSAKGAGAFSVAGLELGMTVDDARQAIRESFGVEPDYDIRAGVMTMRAGGCPQGFDPAAMHPRPEAGWKCLQALFTDRRVAILRNIQLVQTVEAGRTEPVVDALTQRYGHPSSRVSGAGAGAPPGLSRDGVLLAWGHEGAGTMAGQALRATVEPVGSTVVVTVALAEPAQQGLPEEAPTLDLKL